MGDFNRDQFDLALKYAKDLWESVDIMEDKHGAFNIIRVHGVPHWESQGYRTVTKVRLTHVIEGRGAAQETRPALSIKEEVAECPLVGCPIMGPHEHAAGGPCDEPVI